MLLIDEALETVYLTAGIARVSPESREIAVRPGLDAASVGPSDFALLPTPEVALLTETHRIDPDFGLFTSERGAIALRCPVRPDEIEEASILLYDVSGTAEVLARATIWPFYGIRATAWTAVPDGTSSITVVDGLDALEPVEAGFSEDLVRAWYILTDQPVVTHLLAVPRAATEAEKAEVRQQLGDAFAAGYAERRDIRKLLLEGTAVDPERLVEYLAAIRYELDDGARMAAYSLLARGAGGTRYPLLRELAWATESAEDRDSGALA